MLIGDVWISPPMVKELSERTGLHRTTIARWLKKREFPKAAGLLLRILLSRELEPLHDAWCGWSIDKFGDLTSPTGFTVTPGEILAMQLRHQYTAALECELRQARADRRADAADRVGPPQCADQSATSADAAAKVPDLSVVSL